MRSLTSEGTNNHTICQVGCAHGTKKHVGHATLARKQQAAVARHATLLLWLELNDLSINRYKLDQGSQVDHQVMIQ